MGSDITYENMNERLAEAIPELAPAYSAFLDEWGLGEPPGPHVIYGDLLAHHIVSLAKSSERKDDLRRTLEFVEALATHPDANIRNVIAVSVIEWIVGWYSELLPRLRSVMGPATRDLLDAFENWQPDPEEIAKAWTKEALLHELRVFGLIATDPELGEKAQRHRKRLLQRWGHLLDDDGAPGQP